jgi:hypothetical protein
VTTGAQAHPAPGPARPPAPPAVRRAVRVMYGGAALSVAGIFVNLTTLGRIKRRLPVTSPELLASTQHQAIAEFIVGGLVSAAVWIFMAISCRARMRWARLAGTALFAIDTVYTVDVAASFDRFDAPVAVRVYTVAVWLTGLTTTLLLWQRAASGFFRPGRPGRPEQPDATASRRRPR